MLMLAIGFVAGLLVQIAFPMLGFRVRDLLAEGWAKVSSAKNERL